MPGPLPAASKRRRNAPTIPSTHLPASGRKDRAPRLPSFAHLGKAGRSWWNWAWKTPQAAAWSPGHEAIVARRAALEDDLDALGQLDRESLTKLFGDAADELDAVVDHVMWVVGTLKRVTGGKLAITREMRELDDRLGLTPKSMAALRWTIKPDVEPEEAEGPTPDKADELEERRRRLAADAS